MPRVTPTHFEISSALRILLSADPSGKAALAWQFARDYWSAAERAHRTFVSNWPGGPRRTETEAVGFGGALVSLHHYFLSLSKARDYLNLFQKVKDKEPGYQFPNLTSLWTESKGRLDHVTLCRNKIEHVNDLILGRTFELSYVLKFPWLLRIGECEADVSPVAVGALLGLWQELEARLIADLRAAPPSVECERCRYLLSQYVGLEPPGSRTLVGCAHCLRRG
jgi:hypothetical protein